MGCTTCGGSSSRTATRNVQAPKTAEVDPNCPYTIEQVEIWLDKVKCIMAQGLYSEIPNITKRQVNIYINYLLSAMNYVSKPCYFEKELDEIESFITVITALNLCNNN